MLDDLGRRQELLDRPSRVPTKEAHATLFIDGIPRLSDQERAIFACLLHHNQNTFFGAMDGGHPAAPIGQGFIVEATRRGRQTVDVYDFPYMIPDHIRVVLQLHKADFPYVPERPGETRAHPWRRGYF